MKLTTTASRILSLLKDGPQPFDALALWCDQPVKDVRRALRSLKRDGLAKRVGVKQHWAVGSWVAKPGRKFSKEDTRAAILQLLADGPKTSVEVGAAVGLCRSTLRYHILMIGAEVKLIGGGPKSRLALASYEPPAQALEDIEADDDDVTVDDFEDDDEDLPQPDPPRQSTKAAKPAQRQPHERPTRLVLKADAEPSWWVNKERAAFSEVAAQQIARMRESKEARQIQPRILL